MIFSLKAFSYAGERCAILGISNKLANRHYPDLKAFCGQEVFARGIIFGALHPKIFGELDGDEGLLVASKIADKSGITRSVIVNALRKLESAGVIEVRTGSIRILSA